LPVAQRLSVGRNVVVSVLSFSIGLKLGIPLTKIYSVEVRESCSITSFVTLQIGCTTQAFT